MKIVTLCRELLPQAAALEALCFPEPWSESALGFLLTEEATGVAALDDGGTLIGYGGMLFAPDEGQILNLAVAPGHRRQGVGSQILSALLSAAAERRLSSVSLEVRVSNFPAVALYEHSGFAIAGRRSRFYKHPVEDAFVMIRSGNPSAKDHDRTAAHNDMETKNE